MQLMSPWIKTTMPKIQEKPKKSGETKNNVVLNDHHTTTPEQIFLHQEFQMITQLCLGHIGHQKFITSHKKV